MKKYDIQILTKDEFPEKLKNIDKSPKKLHYIGNKDLFYEDSFAVIGTRKITEYGIGNCEFFTKELVLRDIPIVSGMALGTDTIAHTTALKFSGKTIAVLGSGFNNIFPKENEKLFEDIIENGGLVVTEYEDDVLPLKSNFPKRNRIITALSEGVLVIEAAYRSGTSITAKNAKEQNKNVFALPGRLDNYLGIGVNNLIKEGAILTTNVEDILECYPQFESRLRKNIREKSIKCENKNHNIDKIKDEYKEIYRCLENKELSIEEIMIESNIDLKKLLKLITLMEIEKLIKRKDDGKYKVIE